MAEVLRALRRRHAELHARAIPANCLDAGLDPRELLFHIPVRAYARAFPALVRDTARIVRRKKANDWRDIPAVDRHCYPPYYRRTFHWQTDGYLSEHSAAI